MIRIALAGNPNSGKTTMFNALTGRNEKVGNWAGVTVDKKEHHIKKHFYSGEEQLIAIDLPGAYSMSPFTSEESVTSSYIKDEKPDVIINIVDSMNLSRSLFFTTQLLELGIPVVVALNKNDLSEKKETIIDAKVLSKMLGCPVLKTSSVSHDGLHEIVDRAVEIIGSNPSAPYNQGDVDFTDKEAVKHADYKRFAFVKGIVEAVETRKVFTKDLTFSDKVDKLLTNRWVGIPFFALVMFCVFYISQTTLGTWIAEGYELSDGRAIPGLVTILELFQNWVGSLLSDAHPILQALLVDGVIGGLVAVMGFLPLVMVMYFLIAILEDCGYMSRVAVVLDPIFKKVGLSGKSVIPFVMSVGCAVPGVMASRTIHNERERRTTAMLAPFMPCGAKIPVIALFAGAFFDNAGWVSTLMYLLGIVIIFFGALLANKLTGNSKRKSYFIIELPGYKAPSFKIAFKSMCNRGWAYIVKASTIILLCNTAVQIMQSFTWSFTVAQTADASILASVAKPFAYILFPVFGVISWQLAAATVTGFIAKENVVGTLAVCFVGLENFIDTEELAMLEGAGEQVAGVMAITKITAMAFLLFNLFSPPCFAAIGAMSAEMKSRKWLFAGIGLQLGMGYTIAYIFYTFSTLVISPEALDKGGALIGLAVVVALWVLVCVLIGKNKEEKIKIGITK